MDNLSTSIEYTERKKKEQITKLESHYSKSIQEIKEFLDQKKSAVAVTSGFEYLSIWYQWNYINTFLDADTVDYEMLASATIYGIESNNVRYFLGKKVETYKQSIQFHKAIKHVAQALLLGWESLAIDYGRLLIKMLYGKQYNGWHPAYKHPWFMLEIFCKWQGIKLDYSKLNYPDDMGPYKKVLENWNTNDMSLVSDLVNQMSTFHIEQSDEDEYKDKTPDFPSSDYFIYAIEILFWLNIRKKIGLPDYSSDNELIKMPINNWNTQNIKVPQIELIQKAKSKLLYDYPGIEFELLTL